MYYQHEVHERKPNTHPMCTELPPYEHDLDDNMREYLKERNLDSDLAKANGWFFSCKAGDVFPRIVIPAVTWKPGHVYYQARDITGKAFIRYQSPKGPRHEAIIKVVPIDIDEHRPIGIVVVEGPCCSLAAAQAGYLGVALMGKMPSQATLAHLALLIQDNAELPVLVLLDRDCTNEAVRIVTFLASQGFNVKMGQFTQSKDLAELGQHERTTLLRKYFSQVNSSSKKSKN